MDDDLRRALTEGRLVMKARTIVLMGVWSLLAVLIGILTVGTGSAFVVVVALSFLAQIGFILAVHWCWKDLER